MSNLINKLKTAFSGRKKDKTIDDSGHVKPSRDWKILLLINLIIVCAIAFFSYYFYKEVGKGSFFKIENTETLSEIKLNNTLLNKVVEGINKREATSENIRNKNIAIPSPTF